MGHFTHPSRIAISKDLRFVYSIGELNGIYKWSFYGDASLVEDLSQFCEELESEKLAALALTDD
jgi:hypothetical protein